MYMNSLNSFCNSYGGINWGNPQQNQVQSNNNFLQGVQIDVDGNILQNVNGQTHKLGVITSVYDEVYAAAEKFEDKLRELGELPPKPKTLEELELDRQQMMFAMLKLMEETQETNKALKSEIEELKLIKGAEVNGVQQTRYQKHSELGTANDTTENKQESKRK